MAATFNYALILIKKGIMAFYDYSVQLLEAISPLGIYLLLGVLSISLVWRYLVGQLFK